jgi:putative oxygen-independent coproporphyrinogen III oxidase
MNSDINNGSGKGEAHRANQVGTHAGNLVTQIFKPSELRFTSALPPLSLYIHLPWCVRKCPYCDFNSHLAPESKFREVAVSSFQTIQDDQSQANSLPLDLQKQYLQALIADLDMQLPKIWGRRLHTIFIGGGTPSLFHPDLIDELLAAVRARLGMPATGEITMEANPGTFEQHRFEGFKKAGVTRLSIGVQSFNTSHLKALGRIHNGEQAIAAVRSAVQLFDEVNVDLMYGLPHQSVDQALADVQQALSLKPTHLSLYQLTMEPNTLFAVKPPPLPDEDTLVDIEEAVHALAAQGGFERYEVSAFAKPGHRCHHNVNYWGFGDYLGIGAGAHAKISYPNRIERETRPRNPAAYMASKLAANIAISGAIHLQDHQASEQATEARELKVSELPFEFMLNALRLIDGVPESYFTERCGRPVNDLQRSIKLAVERGLLDAQPGLFKATPHGVLFLNELIELFL